MRTLADCADLVPTGSALSQVGQLHLDLAKLAKAYQENLAAGYLATLESRTNELRAVDLAVNEAEKKRKTLESVLTKVRQASLACD